MSKGYKSRRELCLRRMREIHHYSLLAVDNVAQRPDFLVRYPTVLKLVEEFEGTHLRIFQEATNDKFAIEDAIRDEFDTMRFAVIERYESLVAAERATASQVLQPAPGSAIRLPKIALPQFAGDLALWLSFIVLFNTAIHENDSVSAIEKFQYLLASLSEEALGVVKNLPLTAENYVIAYHALLARYQNKRKLATQCARLYTSSPCSRIPWNLYAPYWMCLMRTRAP
ncbi:uncharacterized protein LOC143897662 [Temnothorax americanus]|uniref:uncharacterized protein LOC143897662 n=1 Tax=Temnothorax americanus TaxID=1964332 RepID=UPI0040689451